jgi:hypothetical protein
MMPQETRKIVVISAIILLSLAIGFLVIANLFTADTNPTQQAREKIPGTERTIHTNVSEVFIESQEKQAALLENVSGQDEQYRVPPDVARMYAEVGLARLMYTRSQGLAGTNFTDVTLYSDPVIVYDDSGERPKYYKFYAGVRGFKNTLQFVPASKLMGYCCTTPELGMSDDKSDRIMLQRAQEFYNANANGSDIVSVKFLASTCWGQIIKLDLVSPQSNETRTMYFDNGILRDQGGCAMAVNTSSPAISGRIAEGEMCDEYCRTIQEDALAAGINLTEPCSWENREKMRGIFQSVEVPRVSSA